jgi:hypothetical protein
MRAGARAGFIAEWPHKPTHCDRMPLCQHPAGYYFPEPEIFRYFDVIRVSINPGLLFLSTQPNQQLIVAGESVQIGAFRQQPIMFLYRINYKFPSSVRIFPEIY